MRRWAQTTRLPHVGVVGIHYGTPNNFAQRVYRDDDFQGEASDVLPTHEVWTSVGAAKLV